MIHESSEYSEPKTAPNNQARLWGSTIGVFFVVVFTVLLGVMGYRFVLTEIVPLVFKNTCASALTCTVYFLEKISLFKINYGQLK